MFELYRAVKFEQGFRGLYNELNFTLCIFTVTAEILSRIQLQGLKNPGAGAYQKSLITLPSLQYRFFSSNFMMHSLKCILTSYKYELNMIY